MNVIKVNFINGYNMVRNIIKYTINVKIKIVRQRKLYISIKKE